MIAQAAPWRRIARFRSAIDAKISATLSSASYVLGPEVDRFEQAFAQYLGVRHCVGVASGTDGLALALRALGIGQGDEVITVSMTAAATAAAILHCNATPRFVDVNRATRCIDVASVEAAITPATAAIIPVHLHGHPADMSAIMRIAGQHGIAVLEDCAHAHGAHLAGRKIGTFGHAAAFSFYPTKNLGGIGDGGAVVTSDDALAAKLVALRAYGWSDGRRVSEHLGWNSRLDEIQAAVLSVLLPELDQGNLERGIIADVYRRGLSEALAQEHLELPPENPGSVNHQFAIAVRGRDAVRDHLMARGIGTGIHYTPALHRQPAFERYAPEPLPETETLANGFISLPIQPEVVGSEASRVVAAVVEAIRATSHI